MQVETFGDPDDFLRWRSDGTIHSHQSELEATLFYCSPGVTGVNCTLGFGLPNFDAWPGEGQWYVNSEIDTSFEFTCPSLIVGHGTVTDRDSGDRYSIRTRMVRIKTAQGTCRVSGQATAFLTAGSRSDRSGSSAKCSFQSLGVSISTLDAGWMATRCSTSTRYV